MVAFPVSGTNPIPSTPSPHRAGSTGRTEQEPPVLDTVNGLAYIGAYFRVTALLASIAVNVRDLVSMTIHHYCFWAWD